MALPDITQRLKLQAEGVKETEASSANIHKNLVGAAQAAEALARAQAANARKASAQTPRENLEYNQMRGTAGVTGAAARDFADQSRGLGPLIRLYAAFAANVFALSAAFGVLRNAADTSNLIEGLNTLGAVSGKALGTVAKQLVQASDGAISLRDAMSSVAMTSSAGMTSQNILRLGAVAKSASLALGVNMPDALNRLSRGITKLEPELLDELGIFTKIEPATQAYALQLGKAVSQLTDFERRQAFANAVLKEGEEKFAALADAKANPYDKLLASLQNVAFSGLELLNTVLKPIVEVLASSPTALALGLAAIIAAILKRAIPAVADLRAAFGKKLQDSIDETQTKIEGLKSSYKQLAEYSVKQASEAADARVDKVVAAEKKILDFYKQNAKVGPQGALLTASPQFQTIIKENPLELDQQALTKLKAAHADYLRQVSSGNQKLTSETKERIKLEAEFIKVLEEQLAGEQSFSTLRTKALQQAEEAAKNSRLGISLEKDIQALKLKGRKDEIVQMAVSRANTLGVGIAWKLLKIDIDNASTSIEKFAARTALVQGALGIVGGKLLSTLNGVGSALTAISIGAAVFAVFESLFSKNEKQMQAFKASIDAANESTLNTKRTLAELDRAGLGKSLTDTAISLSNAFAEISSSAQKLVVDARLAKEASTGFFDTIVEGFKDFTGYGIDDQVAKGLSKQLISALDILNRSGIDEKYRQQFKQLLQVKDLSAGTVETALLNLGDEVRNRFTSLLESARKELDKTRSDLESFKDASDKAVKSYQEFLQSTANTNPLFKLGESMEILADSMINAMNRGTLGIQAAFEEFSKDPKKAALFGKEFIQEFVAVEQGFKDQSNAIREYTRLQQELQQELQKVQVEEEQVRKAREVARKQGKTGLIDKFFGTGAFQGQEALDKSAKLKEQIKAIQEATLQIPKDQIEKGRDLFAKGLDIAFARGAEYIRVALGQAAEKAGLTIAKANSMVLSGERAAEESTRIRLQEIDIQINAVKVNLDLIRENELLQAEMSALRASVDYARVSADQNATAEEKRAAYETKVATGLVASILGGRITQQDAAQQARSYAKSDEILNVPGGVDSNMITRQVNAAVGAVRRKEAQQQARLVELGGDRQAAGIEGSIQKERARLEDRNKILRIENETNQVINARQGILQSIAGLTSQEVIDIEAASERQAIVNRQNVELSSIKLARDQAEAKFDETKQIKFDNERKFQQNLLDATDKKQKADLANFDLQTKRKKLDVTLQDIQKRAELDKSSRDALNALEETRLEIQRAQFTSAAEFYELDKEFVINKTNELDIQRANFETLKQRAEIEATAGTKRLETEARLKQLGFEGAALQAKLAEEQQRITDITNNQLATLESERQKRLEILEIQRQQAIKQAEIADKSDRITRLATAFGGAFGEAGAKLGNVFKVLNENEDRRKKDTQATLLAEEEKTKAAEAAAKYAALAGEKNVALEKKSEEATKAAAKTKAKSIDNELAGQAEIIATTKSLFKQHTAAYKGMAAIEKVIHTMRMANMILELRQTFVNLAASTTATMTNVANAAAEAGATGIAAVIKAMSAWPFPINLAAGAATAAVVGSLLAKVGKSLGFSGGGGGGFVPNAEQQQKVQGTAMGYDSGGKQVQVRRGVFGDTEAKSESISKSLEKIKENSVDGLSYDNRILKTLESIDNGINQTAKRLYSIEGLRTGSMFGTVAGTTTGGGLFNTGLFASKTSTEILDAGIKINGSFAELASDTNQGAINFYETVKTTTKKFLRRAKTSIKENLEPATDTLNDFFTDIFSNAQKLITQIGVKTGTQTAEGVQKILSQFEIKDLKISLRGLTGEALAKEVESVISSILDDATLAVFQSFEQYAEFGEGMLETVIRVTDTNEKIAQQVRNLGIATDLTNLFDTTEALAAASDGLDNFIDKTQFFRENFLTEAERLAPITQSVGKEIARLSKEFPGLGIEAVDTKEEFKNLVRSLDLSTDSGFELFNALLNVQEGFLQAAKASEELTEGQKIVADLQQEIFSLTSGMTALDKSLADIDTKATDYVKQLEKTGEATAENILVIGKWVQATRLDLLKNAVVSSFNAVQDGLKNQISTLTTVKQRLVDLKNSLLQGAESVLTPQEKLIAAQTEYNALLAAAKTGDQAAVDKFSGYAQTLLSATRDVYASGEEYTKVFNKTMADIDTVTTKVSGDLSTAEKQLQANQDTASGIQVIKDALTSGGKSLAQLQDEFNRDFSNYRTQEAKGAIDAIKESTIKTNVIELYTKLLGRAPEQSGLEFWTRGLMGNLTSLSAVENAIRNSEEGVNYAQRLKTEQAALTAALKPTVTVEAPIINVQAPAPDNTLTEAIKTELANLNGGVTTLNTTIAGQSTKADDDTREVKAVAANADIQTQAVRGIGKIIAEGRWDENINSRYGRLSTE